MLHILSKNNFLFVCCILLLFLIDLGQFFLIGITVIPFLLSLYCALLCSHQHYTFLIIVALLQCLEYFCFYNFFSLALLPIVPVTTLALFFKKYLYPSRIHRIALVLTCCIIQVYAIEGYFLHIYPPYYYTIMRIGAILFITICFSLKLKSWGMLDNRA